MRPHFGGDCAANGTVSLVSGDNKTCLVTNDDVAPQLTVTKVVVNDDGGTRTASEFPLFIDGGSVTTDVANIVSVGAHTVSETQLSGYLGTIGGDCAADGTVTLALGESKQCTITNQDILDADGDGLEDRDEVSSHGTDPTKFDTDGDGINDGDEIKNGTNPSVNEAVIVPLLLDLLL